MAKSERLLQLIQLLRVLPEPVQAARLAEELEVSQRSVYRDIDALRRMGAVIDGAAGYGYTLLEDPALPPMMFDTDEIEALVLGLREVSAVADPVLAKAAENVLAKISGSLPERMRRQMKNAVLHAKRFHQRPEISVDVGLMRKAAREELEVEIAYCDAAGVATIRRVWPLSIVFMDQTLVLLAKCQLRQDFRAFRMDRVVTMTVTKNGFRPHRVSLLRDCLASFATQTAQSRPSSA